LNTNEFKYKDITEKIIGACMKVHTTLGCGFQEIIYHRALEIEFTKRNIPYISEMEMDIYYEGFLIGKRRVDFFIESRISLEIKAVTKMDDLFLAQGLNYLEANNKEIGLLVNFGSRSLEVKRLLNKKYKAAIPESNNLCNPGI
jgi:GxxExxY protein